jgi:hypothetical protein
MTVEEAKVIAKKASWVSFEPTKYQINSEWEVSVTLDGDFSIQELEAFIVLMKAGESF